MEEKDREPQHEDKVEELKRTLLKLDLPILPLTTVKSTFYTPDIVTRVDTKFIPIDYINTKERVAPDIGGLCLLYHKDIVDFCLAVIDEELWASHIEGFRKAKLNLPHLLFVRRSSEILKFFVNKEYNLKRRI